MSIKETKTNKENIDISNGESYPINSEEQGKVFAEIKPFMNFMRYHQLIKKITYNIKIEYYPETKFVGEKLCQ